MIKKIIYSIGLLFFIHTYSMYDPLYQSTADYVKKLLALPLNTTTKETASVALRMAAAMGHVNLVQAVLRYYPAAIQAKDTRGNTILMHVLENYLNNHTRIKSRSGAQAVQTFKNNIYAVLQELINKGVPINVKNNSRKTALDLAKQTGESTFVQLLIKAGAAEEEEEQEEWVILPGIEEGWEMIEPEISGKFRKESTIQEEDD